MCTAAKIKIMIHAMVTANPGQTLTWVTPSPRVSIDLMDSAGRVVACK